MIRRYPNQPCQCCFQCLSNMKKQIAIAHKKGEIPPENQDLERKKFILEFDNASFNHLKHISFVVFAVNSGLIASLFKEFNKNKSIILILAIGIFISSILFMSSMVGIHYSNRFIDEENNSRYLSGKKLAHFAIIASSFVSVATIEILLIKIIL